MAITCIWSGQLVPGCFVWPVLVHGIQLLTADTCSCIEDYERCRCSVWEVWSWCYLCGPDQLPSCGHTKSRMPHVGSLLVSLQIALCNFLECDHCTFKPNSFHSRSQLSGNSLFVSVEQVQPFVGSTVWPVMTRMSLRSLGQLEQHAQAKRHWSVATAAAVVQW